MYGTFLSTRDGCLALPNDSSATTYLSQAHTRVLSLLAQGIFRLAHRWRAVLLLDEADVYLERRVTQDVLRNALVSVFLRSLEYYKGIFFLTTNRVGDFDEAVCSRIHLFLKYHDLEERARRKVWETFLQGATTVAGPATVCLITVASNGRQVC
jgi:ATPase family associated with various cellular activities (AAA)